MNIKSMRKEAYIAICDALRGMEGNPIKHIDLWNRNVEFLEQDIPFPMPAVFVEFDKVTWETRGQWDFSAKVRVCLHVVTEWKGSAADGSEYQDTTLDVFDLIGQITITMCETSGETFDHMRRVQSITNHDHETVIENVEIYECRVNEVAR